MVKIIHQARYKALVATRVSFRAPVVGVRGNSLRLAANALRAEPEAIAASAHADAEVPVTIDAIVADVVVDTAEVGDGASHTGAASAAASNGDAPEAEVASEAPPVDEPGQQGDHTAQVVSEDQGVVSASHMGETSAAASNGDAPEAKSATEAPPVNEPEEQADREESPVGSEDQALVGQPKAGDTKEEDAVSSVSDEPTTSSTRQLTSVNTMTENKPQQRPKRVVRPRSEFLDSFPYKVGDEVIGKVSWSNDRGAKIDIQGYNLLHGYMPRNRGPFGIRSGDSPGQYSANDSYDACIIQGVIRKFKILVIPPDMMPGGKGPLLSALDVDLGILFERLRQIAHIGRHMRETVRVLVHGATDRGLLVSLTGLRGFLPVSHVPREKGVWLGGDDLKELYVGKDVEVAIMSVDEDKRSFLCSINNAISDKVLRKLSIGTLVWGTVRKIENYGVFVAIDDTYESALLHIGNISWERVRACEDVFKMGERVRAVVTGMDEGFTRLSVSTRDIEGNEGDMLRSKETVYRDAEQNVKRFLEHVAEWERKEAEWAGHGGRPNA